MRTGTLCYTVLWHTVCCETDQIPKILTWGVSFHGHNTQAASTGVCEKKYHLATVWSIIRTPAPQSCQSWSQRPLVIPLFWWYFFSHGLRVLHALVPTLTAKGEGIPNAWNRYFWMVLFFANTGMENRSAKTSYGFTAFVRICTNTHDPTRIQYQQQLLQLQ